MSNSKTEKKQEKEKPKNNSDLKIEVVEKETIPKLRRQHTGVYALIQEKLNAIDGQEAIVLTVQTRPTAAGLQKFFKPLGYDVISRSEKNKKGDTEIRVYISKTETATKKPKKKVKPEKPNSTPEPLQDLKTEPPIKPIQEPTQ